MHRGFYLVQVCNLGYMLRVKLVRGTSAVHDECNGIGTCPLVVTQEGLRAATPCVRRSQGLSSTRSADDIVGSVEGPTQMVGEALACGGAGS